MESAIDWSWFRRHAVEEILPRWLEAAATPTGFFAPRLDRTWLPADEQRATLVSQGRLLHNFAQGWRLTDDSRYLDAVQRGGEFMARAFRDREMGGWFWSVDPDGRPLETHKDAYGHAFALFGFAHAYHATKDSTFRQAALDVWSTLRARFQDDGGGFVWRYARDFTGPSAGRSINPAMHTLEALLAASTCGVADLLAPAEAVAGLAARLLRPDGLLPEVYSDGWEELAEPDGGVIMLGHQFEWAYLLSAGLEQGLPADLLASADRLLDVAVELAIDQADGGILSRATPDCFVPREGKVYWPQCEALRALLHNAAARGRRDLLPAAGRLLSYIQERFLDHEHGGWFEALDQDGNPTHTTKGHEWKLDYHPVSLCVEAARWEQAMAVESAGP